MKISEIIKLVNDGKQVYVKGKGNVTKVTEKNGKYTLEYEVPAKGKYYGRLTSC